MPNHIHGIIEITGSLPVCNEEPKDRLFGRPVSGSLSTIIGSYKAGVTQKCRKMHIAGKTPLWHRRFHDRIIRDDGELCRIRRYIEVNPTFWEYSRKPFSQRSMEELENLLRTRHGLEGLDLYAVLSSKKALKVLTR
jgi:hypothetical protein